MDDLLEPRLIIETAMEQADDLEDFDGDEWRDGLERLVWSLRAEGDLHAFGPYVASLQITSALSTRLRIVEEHRRHPEIASTPVAPPIVILGQPRTGTTILFDLLAQDPAHRVPLTWEVENPIPPPESATYETDPRIAESAAAAAMTDEALPELKKKHPMGPLRGTECVAITAGDLRSLQYGTVFKVPTYTRWLLNEADMTSAYRYHKQFLQVLQWKHPGERWLLKTPAHLWHLADLFAAYPDALAIHTHRDPLKVLASTASLMETLQQLGREHPTMHDLAEEWLPYLVGGNERAIAARRDGTVTADQIIDVAFADLMADMFGTLGSIYDRLGRQLTPETRSAMELFLRQNPSDKHGKHTYTFSATELDLDEARKLTAAYESHYSVPPEALD